MVNVDLKSIGKLSQTWITANRCTAVEIKSPLAVIFNSDGKTALFSQTSMF